MISLRTSAWEASRVPIISVLECWPGKMCCVLFLAKTLDSQCLSTQVINMGTSASEFNAGEGGGEGG